MDSLKYNPVAAASFAAVSVVLLVSAGTSCSFLTVLANPGQVLVNDDSSNLANVTSASLGLFCPSEQYNLEDDPMYKLSYTMMILSLTFLVLAVLLSCCIVTCLRPTYFIWKTISVLVALAAVLQIPVFLLFQTPPCANYMGQQQCAMDEGSFLLVGAIVCSVTVTLITQCLDPPIDETKPNAEDDGSSSKSSKQLQKQPRSLDDTLVTEASHSTLSHSFVQHPMAALAADTILDDDDYQETKRSSTCSTQIFGSFFQFQKHQLETENDAALITRHWQNLSDDEEQLLEDDLKEGRRQQHWDGWHHLPRGETEFDQAGGSHVSTSRSATPMSGSLQLSPHIQREEINVVRCDKQKELYPPAPSSMEVDPIFRSSSHMADAVEDEKSIHDRPPVQTLRLYSWEDEDENDREWSSGNGSNINGKQDQDISGTESILDCDIRGDESILDTSTYLEDWTIDEVVIKVVKRGDEDRSDVPSPLNAHMASFSLKDSPSSPATTDGGDGKEWISPSESIRSDNIHCLPFSMAVSARSAMPFSTASASSQTPQLAAREDPPVGSLRHSSRSVDTDKRSAMSWPIRKNQDSGHRLVKEDEYDSFLHDLRQTNSRALDPPPMRMVTLNASGDGDLDFNASDTLTDRESGELVTSWNALHGFDPNLPMQTLSTDHSVGTGDDEDSNTYYSDPDLSIGDSASCPSSDSQLSHEEYSQIVVSEVLRRQRRRKKLKKKHRQGSASTSVQSAPSLLDTTIFEETPSDVELEAEEKKSDEPYDPSKAGLLRSTSVPNLQYYEGVSADKAHMLEVVGIDGLNNYHSVRTWHHRDMCGPKLYETIGHHEADDDESSAGGVSESKSSDSPERKQQQAPMPLFREERILRRDLHSVIAMSESTDDVNHYTMNPRQARQVRLQRLQDSRLRSKHTATTRLNSSQQSWLRPSEDAYSMAESSVTLQTEKNQDEMGTNMSENRPFPLHLDVPAGIYRSCESKADPDGMHLTLSFEGSI